MLGKVIVNDESNCNFFLFHYYFTHPIFITFFVQISSFFLIQWGQSLKTKRSTTKLYEKGYKG